jgi:hypothetical protein
MSANLMNYCLDLLQGRSLSYCLQDHLTAMVAEEYTRMVAFVPFSVFGFGSVFAWVG